MVPRLSNTLVSQIEYKVSPRSSWTAVRVLRDAEFFGRALHQQRRRVISNGLQLLRSVRRARIAVIYTFDDFRYPEFPQTTENHVVKLGYARYVTGRLSFQLAAGPSLVLLRGVLTGTANNLSWALDSALNYKWDRTTLSLSFDRLVTGGSGVLVGAQTGQVEATIERTLSPRWRASASIGYATNASLIPIAALLDHTKLQLLVCRGAVQSSNTAHNKLFCELWRTAAGHERHRLHDPELWRQLH